MIIYFEYGNDYTLFFLKENMKLLSFKYKEESSFGLLDENNVIDLKNHFGSNVKSLKDLLKKEKIIIERLNLKKLNIIPIDEIDFLPLIVNPDKILCVGVNYDEHRKETKREKNNYPTIFTRFSESQVGHLKNIVVPKQSDKLDFEGELAVIIGKNGKNLSVENAMTVVAGFSCYNDATVRDWQKHSSQFTPGKNFDNTGAFGPYLVTKDEIEDIEKLNIETCLNGKLMQKSDVSKLIFSIPQLISYCSSFTTLRCGDVIITGTPGGVGDRRNPKVYLQNGDIIEVKISDIGVLKNFVIKE